VFLLPSGFQGTQCVQSIFKSFFFFKAALRTVLVPGREWLFRLGDSLRSSALLGLEVAALYRAFQLDIAQGGNCVSNSKRYGSRMCSRFGADV